MDKGFWVKVRDFLSTSTQIRLRQIKARADEISAMYDGDGWDRMLADREQHARNKRELQALARELRLMGY